MLIQPHVYGEHHGENEDTGVSLESSPCIWGAH